MRARSGKRLSGDALPKFPRTATFTDLLRQALGMTISGYRIRWYWLLIPALIISNLFLHWPSVQNGRRPTAPNHGNGGDSGRDFEGKIEGKIHAVLEKLPSDQRVAIEQRIQAEREFFDSLRSLPVEERREKAESHFSKIPPVQIPGLELPPPPEENGGPGGPGDIRDGGPERGHIPPPDVRRGLDQGIVNALRKGTNP